MNWRGSASGSKEKHISTSQEIKAVSLIAKIPATKGMCRSKHPMMRSLFWEVNRRVKIQLFHSFLPLCNCDFVVFLQG
ncbi:unnamed protein product [Linum tenue]|uniref:Uncharacterized protein n=1 Tax=Linum tenue TaxID=586396 RepID=A0AAV0S8N7_9ROSI|nr:unnamed protein product [Linum tenue]